jgi:hypothetical protein
LKGRLRQVIKALQPRALAFNGKTAAGAFYNVPTGHLSDGRQQPARIGETDCYVLPSTAGAAIEMRGSEALTPDLKYPDPICLARSTGGGTTTSSSGGIGAAAAMALGAARGKSYGQKIETAENTGVPCSRATFARVVSNEISGMILPYQTA